MRESIRTADPGQKRRYLETVFGNKDTPPILPVLKEISFRRNDVILEIGAGTGHFTLPIASRFASLGREGMVYGFDSSDIHIKRLALEAVAQGLGNHLRAEYLDDYTAPSLPFADESVATALSANTIQYLSDPLPCLKEISRVLIPCGSLLISDWRKADADTHRPPLSSGLSPEDLATLLDKAGLDAHLQIDLQGYVWAIRAVKPVVATA